MATIYNPRFAVGDRVRSLQSHGGSIGTVEVITITDGGIEYGVRYDGSSRVYRKSCDDIERLPQPLDTLNDAINEAVASYQGETNNAIGRLVWEGGKVVSTSPPAAPRAGLFAEANAASGGGGLHYTERSAS